MYETTAKLSRFRQRKLKEDIFKTVSQADAEEDEAQEEL